MESKRIQILVEKYVEGTASPEETDELMEWYKRSNEEEVEWNGMEEEERGKLRLRIFDAIQDRTSAYKNEGFRWHRMAAAIAVLIGLSVGGYFYFKTEAVTTQLVENEQPQPIRPGSNGATLVLGNGRTIALGQSAEGNIARQGKATLQKQNDSLLVYQVNGDKIAGGGKVEYNTLHTSRGHQFKLVLPDGSKVWLNAGSSLTYPTAFTGATRTVELVGEAYFEVVHDKNQPFEVITSKQKVKDLGTSFNIHAYPEEPSVKTTLIDGALEVVLDNTGQTRILYPGEQATVNDKIAVQKADVQAVIAWKEGIFIFRSTPVKELMQQIARWYDVDIVYEDDLKDKSIWGSISRYAQVSDVLNMIELTGIAHFKIEGHKVIVTK